MKYLKMGIYELYAIGIIVFATLLRIILAIEGWPPTNSDEGTMGLMALHIAYRGEHPIVFYGQNYMGSLEAYVAAALFRLFGPSLFTLRFGVILLTALFFVSMYCLTSLLYTKKLALVTLLLLSLGSTYLFTRQLIATGGSAETLLFGSLAFLLASWLALSCGQYPSPRRQWWCFLGYGCWGLVVGLGLWTDLVVLPFFVMASLLLVLFCWRDVKTWAPLCLVVGLVIGAFPLIAYNYNALRHGQDSLTILLGLIHGGSTHPTLHQVLQGIKETVAVSVPIATGNPFCPVSELPWIGESSPHSLQCIVIRASWGFGYIILLGMAVVLSALSLWKLRGRVRTSLSSVEERQTIVRHVAQFLLLSSGALAIAAYALSSGPLIWPGIHARYLIGLSIVIPAVIALLWGKEIPLKYRFFADLCRWRPQGNDVGLHRRRPKGTQSPRLRPSPRSTSLSDTFSSGRWEARPSGMAARARPRRPWHPQGPIRPQPSPVPLHVWIPASPLVLIAQKVSGREPRSTQPPPLLGTNGPIPPDTNELIPHEGWRIVRRGVLVLIGILLLIGTVNTFREIPATQVTNQQQDALIHDLVHIGATHIYSDYWTCDRVTFVSKEQIICAVVDPDLRGRHNNRYKPYLSIVSSDPHSTYVLLINSPQAITMAQKVEGQLMPIGLGGQYRRFLFDGYVVYQPI